jgi:hypothetical protein
MITIGSLLFGSEQQRKLRRNLDEVGLAAKLPSHVAGDAVGQLHSQLEDILHIDTVDLLRGFWMTGYKLREAANKSKGAGSDGVRQEVPIHSFSVAWRYEPALEVYVNLKRLYTLKCLVQVTFTISACTAVVERGFITQLLVGPTTATAKLAVAGFPIWSPGSVPVYAGGAVPLPGRGIPLTQHETTSNSHPYD